MSEASYDNLLIPRSYNNERIIAENRRLAAQTVENAGNAEQSAEAAAESASAAESTRTSLISEANAIKNQTEALRGDTQGLKDDVIQIKSDTEGFKDTAEKARELAKSYADGSGATIHGQDINTAHPNQSDDNAKRYKELAEASANAAAESASDASETAQSLENNFSGLMSQAAAEAVAEIVANAPEDFDTMKEISDWIYDHEDDAAAMNSAIAGNTAAIESTAQSLSAHADNTAVHVSSSERTAWNGKYNKPNTGIPKGDLDSAVQASLGKADTAIQSHQDISGKQDKIILVPASSWAGTTKDANKLYGVY